ETPVTTVAGRVHYEEDTASEYWPDATSVRSTLVWEKFFWQSITMGKSFSDSRDLPDADITQTARFRLRQWGLSDNHFLGLAAPCDFDEVDHFLDVSFNSVDFPTRSWNGQTADGRGVQTFDTTGVFLKLQGNLMSESIPVVPFLLTCRDRVDRSGLAFYEIYYERKLLPVDGPIDFRTHPDAGTFPYDIHPFANPPPTHPLPLTA